MGLDDTVATDASPAPPASGAGEGRADIHKGPKILPFPCAQPTGSVARAARRQGSREGSGARPSAPGLARGTGSEILESARRKRCPAEAQGCTGDEDEQDAPVINFRQGCNTPPMLRILSRRKPGLRDRTVRRAGRWRGWRRFPSAARASPMSIPPRNPPLEEDGMSAARQGRAPASRPIAPPAESAANEIGQRVK